MVLKKYKIDLKLDLEFIIPTCVLYSTNINN